MRSKRPSGNRGGKLGVEVCHTVAAKALARSHEKTLPEDLEAYQRFLRLMGPI